MALTGLQIQKLLPKTNCKECGCNTCLAFAMKLAQKKASLDQCPYASDEAKAVLGAAAEPPVRGVVIGSGDSAVKLGEETVLYRHEKTFVRQTALAVAVADNDPEAKAKLAAIREYVVDKVGQRLVIDLIAVVDASGDATRFAAFAKEAAAIGKALILRSQDAQALTAAAAAVSGKRAILASATPETADALAAVAKEHGHVLAITAPDADVLLALSARLREAGCNDLVLEFQTHTLGERFQTSSLARIAALKAECKAFGLPTLSEITATGLDACTQAATEVCKYGGIVILPALEPALVNCLMTLRQNIYTDPQKPIQVEPKLYPIGEPTAKSPVFLTTNFSLTYFIVSGEIENSGTSAWLVIPECEGMSVLTAWAAGKFSGEKIGKFCKSIDLDKQVATREIIIPGYVAQISGELAENLPGWKVTVGPQEAGDIESFLKARSR